MLLTLIDKKTEGPNCYSFIFQPDEDLTWIAGQYLSYKIPNPAADDRHETRFFTISSAPNEKNIQLTTRLSDPGSTFKHDLEKLNIGDTLEAFGPMGNFTLVDTEESYVFLAGGIGITPFRSILSQLTYEGKTFDITLLYANRDTNIVFKEVLDNLADQNSGLEIDYIIDPERIDEKAIKDITDWSQKIYYISGPEPMVQGIKDMLIKMGVLEEKIKTDFFPGYDKI